MDHSPGVTNSLDFRACKTSANKAIISSNAAQNGQPSGSLNSQFIKN